MYHYAKVIRGPHWYDGNLRTGRTEKDPAGEVTAFTLSAAELAEFNARVPPVRTEKKLIETDGERLLRTQHKCEQHKKEENPVAKYTKEEYLQLRAQGKTRAQIAAAWGMLEKSLVGNWYPKWGLHKEDEEEALKVKAPSMSEVPSASEAPSAPGADSPVNKPVETVDSEDAALEEPEGKQHGLEDAWDALRYTDALRNAVRVGPHPLVSVPRPAELYLSIDCPRCGQEHFVSLRILTNYAGGPETLLWWGICPHGGEPILAGVDVRPI